jgi:hypothetical protein
LEALGVGVGNESIKTRACREREGWLKGEVSRQVIFDYVNSGKNLAGKARFRNIP